MFKFINTPVNQRLSTRYTGRTTTTPTSTDPIRGAPRLSVNRLSKFCGFPVKFEYWNIMTTATSGQTNYVNILDSQPTLGDSIAKINNTELCHILLTELMKGSGYHVISKVVDTNGYEA